MLSTPLIFLLLGTVVAQLEKDPDQIKPQNTGELTEKVPAVTSGVIANSSLCPDVANSSPGIDWTIPFLCCNFNTRACYDDHNGKCMRRWEAGFCDYTDDKACHLQPSHWPCTCCASCEGPNQNNSCQQQGNNCRKSCRKDEYFVWWHSCSHQNCRCCRKYCQEDSCANGKGRCLHKSHKRPRGWYPYGSCKGLDCVCYVPCSYSRECNRNGGFCEWKGARCPLGYTEDNCKCHEDACRCCSVVTGPNVPGGDDGVIKVRASNHMEVEFAGGRGSRGDAVAEPKPMDETAAQSLQEQNASKANGAAGSESGPTEEEEEKEAAAL